MSKRVKSLVERDISNRLKDVDGVAVLNPRGINAIKNNLMRRRLHEKGLRMMVVKNTLVKRATAKSKLNGFEKLLDGPCALVFGKASVSVIARALMDEKKQDETLELRGAFFDGEIYVGEEGVKTVSKLPTREEAIGMLVASIMGPGRKLASALKGPGGTLGAILKSIEEKAKDKEGAAPVASA